MTDPKSESLAPATSVNLPVNLLQAALACASTDEARGALCGVHLHRVGPAVRMVASDGHRMFVAATPLPVGKATPTWLDQGVTLDTHGLKSRLAILADGGPLVCATHTAGLPRLELADPLHHAAFQMPLICGVYPEYEKIIATFAGSFATEGHNDFRPVGFAGDTLKGVAEIAKLVGGKDARVAVYARDEESAAIVTFPAQPGVLLYALPVRVNHAMAEHTAAILAPAIRGTLAALRAHQSRHNKVATTSPSAAERLAAEAKAAEYGERIREVIERTGNPNALPAPTETPANPAKAPKSGKGKAASAAAAAPVTPPTTTPTTPTDSTGDATAEGAPDASEPAPVGARPTASARPQRIGGSVRRHTPAAVPPTPPAVRRTGKAARA